MVVAFFIICAWLIGSAVFYKYATDLSSNTLERVWYSALWPAILPLWVIYYLYNRHW